LFLELLVLRGVEFKFGELKATEFPVEGDDAIGCGELEEGLGEEVFEKFVAEGDEEGFVVAFVEEEGGKNAVTRRVLGDFGFAFLGFWARGVLGVGAVGCEFFGGDGERCGHGNLPCCGGKFFYRCACSPRSGRVVGALLHLWGIVADYPNRCQT